VPSREFILTNANGEFDLEGTKKLFLPVFSKMKDVDASEVVLDVREAYSKMTAFDLYQRLPILNGVENKRSWENAIVYRPKDEFDRAKIFELCAQNWEYQVGAFQVFEEGEFSYIPLMMFESRLLSNVKFLFLLPFSVWH
jgi:hypothetical protein